MDKDLIDATKKSCADYLFKLACEDYHKTNKGYLQKQISIVKEYLTSEKKECLSKHGYDIT